MPSKTIIPVSIAAVKTSASLSPIPSATRPGPGQKPARPQLTPNSRLPNARRSIARAFGHLTGSPRRDRELKLDKAEQFDSASGIGIKGVVSVKTLAIGNATLMEQLGIDVVPLANQVEVLRARGASVMHLAVDGKLAELLAVSDPVKASTQEALTMLRKSGLRIIMTTGDGLTTAQAVGKRLGIDEVHGEVKPEDKLQLVERLQRRYESSRWLVTASTTRPRSPKRMSASQWALSPTSR